MGSLSGTLYIGFTGNLHKRIEHQFHQREGFTDRYDVERLLYWASFDDVHTAVAREKQLKVWPCELDRADEWRIRNGWTWRRSGVRGWRAVVPVGMLRLSAQPDRGGRCVNNGSFS